MPIRRTAWFWGHPGLHNVDKAKEPEQRELPTLTHEKRYQPYLMAKFIVEAFKLGIRNPDRYTRFLSQHPRIDIFPEILIEPIRTCTQGTNPKLFAYTVVNTVYSVL
jgi:hypothetical protein